MLGAHHPLAVARGTAAVGLLWLGLVELRAWRALVTAQQNSVRLRRRGRDHAAQRLAMTGWYIGAIINVVSCCRAESPSVLSTAYCAKVLRFLETGPIHLLPQTASLWILYRRATLLSPPLTLLQVGSILINLGTVCGVTRRGTGQNSSCVAVLNWLLITECHEAGPQQALSGFAREQQAPYQVLFRYYTLAISSLAAHNIRCVSCAESIESGSAVLAFLSLEMLLISFLLVS